MEFTLESDGILFGNVNFDLDILHQLEKDLDINEKISLVFLLYDDVPIAQEKLFLINKAREQIHGNNYEDTNLLYDWACHHKKYWKKKLIEALLIIKAYSNINKLLLNVGNLKIHFLPHVLHASIFINPVKKILYNICECLVQNQVLCLVNSIREDYKSKNISVTELYQDNEYYVKYFELYLLDLLQSKYIQIKKDKEQECTQDYTQTCIMNLIEVFNKMNLKKHAEELKYGQKFVNKSMVKDKKVATSQTPNTSSLPQVNTDDNSKNKIYEIKQNNRYTSTSNESIYKIFDYNNMGWIFIVNQLKFENKQKPSVAIDYKVREGSMQDEDMLVKTWTSFGFTPIVHRNLKRNTIFDELKSSLEGVENAHSAFVLCILSHGKEDVIISSDGLHVSIEDIEKLFDTSKAPKLAGKPKILIIQSCQGDRRLHTVNPSVIQQKRSIQSDGPEAIRVPDKSDMIKFYSTIPHFESFRDPDKGTWFIQTLCRNMSKVEKNKSINFRDLCTDVTREVSEEHYNGMTQMPIEHSTFTKKLYLKKIKD